MEQRIITFTKAFLAGICISIGGTVFLSVDNKIIGSLLFSLGLLTIMKFKLNLFTGQIGYILETKRYVDIVIVALGNVFGTIIYGTMIRETYVYPNIQEKCNTIVNNKLNQSYISLLFLAIFCGILMYAAVEEYRKSTQNLLPILCVSVFILCGYEHSIAYSVYSGIAGDFNIPRLMVVFLGNTIGSVFWNYFTKLEREY